MFDASKDDLEKTLRLNDGQTIKKWYVKDSKDTFFYSEEGNKKIRRAEEKKRKHITLFNEDLNLIKKTHTFDVKNKKLKHWQQQVSNDVTFKGDRLTIQIGQT